MEARVLKKRLAIRLVVYIAIIVTISLLCVFLIDQQETRENNLSRINNDISSLQRKLQGLSEQAIQFSEAVKVWEGLPDNKKLLQGLRISDAKDLMDKFEKEYYISNVNVIFSKPEKVTEELVSSTVEVMKSTVSIKFSAISDVHVFDFIDAVLNEYPGYVHITSLTMNRSQMITKDVLTQIANGGKPSLVDAKLDFIWYGLNYKGPVKATEGEQPQEGGGV